TANKRAPSACARSFSPSSRQQSDSTRQLVALMAPALISAAMAALVSGECAKSSAQARHRLPSRTEALVNGAPLSERRGALRSGLANNVEGPPGDLLADRPDIDADEAQAAERNAIEKEDHDREHGRPRNGKLQWIVQNKLLNPNEDPK